MKRDGNDTGLDIHTHTHAHILYVCRQQQNTKIENKSTTVSIMSYKWVYKACFTSWKNIECCVTERADNALSHRLLSPWGDMGTDDFVFTRKGIQIRRVFGGWSPSVEESNYLLPSWGASLFESVPGVLGWSWVSEIEKVLVIVLYEALSHIKRPNNKWHFWEANYYGEFWLEIPSTLRSSIPLVHAVTDRSWFSGQNSC